MDDEETRYYGDLFICCDVEKTGRISMLKASEFFRSANISNEVLNEITLLASIPSTALHISRSQFYSCLKLIAAHQSSMPLRQETLFTTTPLPLPRFSWKGTPSLPDSSVSSLSVQMNGTINAIPPPPSTDRKNSLTRRQDWQEVTPTSSRKNSSTQQQLDAAVKSDVPSTDSEVEQHESSSGVVNSGGHSSNSRGMRRRRAGSPETWSTNSDSPTPTNSVAERPWTNGNLWHGLLADEHRQLLGTEEESSDRHSSDDDIQDAELESIYQITPEQLEYYYNHFKAVQQDQNGQGLLSGQVARNFFEKSRVPIEELRHIWQICDVTRDNALSLYEFIAAMHLVVLRHNNIPLPKTLPAHLHPNALQNATLPSVAPKQVVQSLAHEPPEADLLHLHDDDQDNTENTITTIINTTAKAPNNDMNMSTLSTTSQDIPPTQWTKFTESPTSNVSSPKPVNFDMQRTAQAVVSDPQILHPVPLRVTPVAGGISNSTPTASETQNQENHDDISNNSLNFCPKQIVQVNVTHQRDPLQQQGSDLRAIQRPQAKKLPAKNAGGIPPPPQREPSVGNSLVGFGVNSGDVGDTSDIVVNINTNNNNNQQIIVGTKKDMQPPLPPPRPHRHGRSNSLDLNKLKINIIGNGQQAEVHSNIEQQHSLPPNQMHQLSSATTSTTISGVPPRITLQSKQRVSAFEVYRKPDTSRNMQLQSPAPSPLLGVPSLYSQIHLVVQQQQQHLQPMYPPPPMPFGAVGAAAIAGAVPLLNTNIYEKRVNAITDSLRYISFRPESNITDILRHLREQNTLLLHLCNDLSDELLSVQTCKEELRIKIDTNDINIAGNSKVGSNVPVPVPVPRTGSSISAPVTANITGGSGSSSVHSNV